jgi:D-lactate dehydrogenase (cytochrome)
MDRTTGVRRTADMSQTGAARGEETMAQGRALEGMEAGPQTRADALARIGALVGAPYALIDPALMAPFLADERGLYTGRAAMVVRPATTDEVAAVVRICADAGIAIVPQGGNTSLVGGSVPHEHGQEIVLSLSRLNRIRSIDTANDSLVAEAGVTLAEVQAAAAEADRLFPLSMASEGSCQVGGVLSTNAGGTAVLRYGNARDLALGIEVVLADGRVLDLLSGLRKDNTGYDTKQLFIGAEGTLGIITAAVLKLYPRPREVETAFVALSRLDAVTGLLPRLRQASGDAVSAFELIPRIALDLVLRHVPGTSDPLAGPHPWYVLVELSTSRAGTALREALEQALGLAVEDGLVADATLASSGAQRAALWRLREAIPAAQKREGGSIKHDIAVPVARVPEFIETASRAVTAEMAGIRVVAFGHAGDGNIHFNLTQPEGMDRDAYLARWFDFNRIVHDIVAGMGGTVSAEHGIGRLKRGEFARYADAAEIELMRRIKAALDPKGILNPGKLLPPE